MVNFCVDRNIGKRKVTNMELTPTAKRFVLHWGEMGTAWGVNRTVGQIYALLFVAERPLNADEIVERLGVSRSNVSMGLKELQAWQLVKLRHQPGDRRERRVAAFVDDREGAGPWAVSGRPARRRRRA